MVNQKSLSVIQELRKNARQSLTDISRCISIPLSSLFKSVKKLEDEKVILKYSALLDYNRIGYSTRVFLSVQVKEKEKFKKFMMGYSKVNSLSRASSNSFFAELIFRNMLELEDFLENLERFGVQNQEVYHIIQEIKKEEHDLGIEDV